MLAAILNSAILNSGHLWFSHLSLSSQTDSDLPRLIPTISTKKIQSFILTQLDDGSHLEFCHVGFRHYHHGIRHLVYLLSDSLKNILRPLWLTQTNSMWLNLMMATILNSSILNSVILDSAILHKTLTQTGSIWVKLIHSNLNKWWQPSCILPSWIWPSWIQPS